MKCLNCEGELFENEFKDLQCVKCRSIYPFSNKGPSKKEFSQAKCEGIKETVNKMTDKKLTDKKIIKALECCAKSSWLNDCDGCPCFDPKEDIQTSECQERLMKYALDFINRLQAQNKDLAETVHNLTLEKDALFDKAEELKAEIERLEKTEIEIDDFCRRLCCMRMLNGSAIASYEDLQNYIQEEKSEAVKNFVERLKEKSFETIRNYGLTKDVVEVCDIDNLLEEFERKEDITYDD